MAVVFSTPPPSFRGCCAGGWLGPPAGWGGGFASGWARARPPGARGGAGRPPAGGGWGGELRVGLPAGAAAGAGGGAELPPGEGVRAGVGARPLEGRAAANYYRRNWTEASLDVNQLQVGAPRTIVPALAHATVTQ